MTILSSRHDAAELVLALTSSDEKKALVSAALARKGLSRISQKWESEVAALWDAANKEALAHLNIVLKNNPKKDPKTILARPDVRSALRYPYEQAAKKSEALIRSAWEESKAETTKKVKGEFKLLGVSWAGAETDEKLLESLVGDLHANAKGMRSRYQQVLTTESSRSTKDRLESLTRDVQLRARYSTSMAVWGAASQLRESAFDKAGLNKMWVCMMDAKACSSCKALHGTVVKPFVQFSKTAGLPKLKAYLGYLFGPPRHPNCRCVLVPTKKSPTKS